MTFETVLSALVAILLIVGMVGLLIFGFDDDEDDYEYEACTDDEE